MGRQKATIYNFLHPKGFRCTLIATPGIRDKRRRDIGASKASPGVAGCKNAMSQCGVDQ
jgi:hypothetical protein